MVHSDRRTFLKATGAASIAGVTGLSGCIGGLGGGGTPKLKAAYVVPIENIISLLEIEEVRNQLDNLGSAYELELTRSKSTPELINTLAAGDLDVGVTAYASFPGAINKDAVPGGMTGIAAGFYDAMEGYFAFPVYSMQGSGIKSAKDLKGKKIGVNALGTGVHAILYRMLQKVGLNPEKDVQFVEIAFPAMGSALREGKIDAGIFPSTFAAVQRSKGGIQTVFTARDAWGQGYPFTILAARNKVLNKNEEAIRAWAQDYVSMIQYAYDNRQKVVKLASEHFGLPEKLLGSFYLTKNDYFRPKDGHVDVESFQFVVDELAKMGFLNQSPDLSKHVTNKYLP